MLFLISQRMQRTREIPYITLSPCCRQADEEQGWRPPPVPRPRVTLSLVLLSTPAPCWLRPAHAGSRNMVFLALRVPAAQQLLGNRLQLTSPAAPDPASTAFPSLCHAQTAWPTGAELPAGLASCNWHAEGAGQRGADGFPGEGNTASCTRSFAGSGLDACFGKKAPRRGCGWNTGSLGHCLAGKKKPIKTCANYLHQRSWAQLWERGHGFLYFKASSGRAKGEGDPLLLPVAQHQLQTWLGGR